MNVFKDRVDKVAAINDFQLFANELGEYAVQAMTFRSSILLDMAAEELKRKLTDHLLYDFLGRSYGPGSYYIRAGGEALLPFVYSRLTDHGQCGRFDLAHVLSLAEEMKYDFEVSDRETISTDTIKKMMTWADQTFKFTTSVLRSEPMFLIMDQAPVRESSFFLRESCEVCGSAFIFWRTGKNTLLAAPHETSFLLRLADMIVREAWLTDIYYVSAIMEEMRALGYAVYDSVASYLWTFYLGEDTGGRTDLCQHVLAAGRNELDCFDIGRASRESDGYGRYTGLQIEADYN